MSLLHAIVLGILQGLGEFLPISSSGHLIAVPWLLGWADHDLAFDVALHLGTLAAVVFAFAGDWWRLIAGGIAGLRRGRPFADPEGRLLWLLAAATVPGVLAGLLLEKWADTVLRAPVIVATSMFVMGAVLLMADRSSRGRGEVLGISVKDALLIGLAQAFAIVPGVSRSGATITMALFLGYKREEAARFSFLLAMPITFGAAVYKVPELFAQGGDPAVIFSGILAAGVVGFLSIRFLLAFVRARDYRPFAYYRFGFAALIWGALLVRGTLLR
jgi:undecaprenyl-diphosphatase